MNTKWITRSAMFLGLAGALLMAGGEAQAAVISLSPSTPTPGVSDFFSVDVLVTGVFDAPHDIDDALFGYGFNVGGLPPGIVSFLGFTPGALFLSLPVPGTDVVGVALDFFIEPPVAEPLLLATLNFQAIGPGVVVLSVSADPIGNPNQGLLYLNGSEDIEASTTLNVTAADVPEPGSVLLTAVGLALVAMRVVKR